MEKKGAPVSATRLRIGIIIWILSWMPFPSLIIHILHENGKVTSSKDTSAAYAVLWTVQILIGLCGLFLAGKETLALAKADGAKGLPRNLWHIVIHGQAPAKKLKADTDG